MNSEYDVKKSIELQNELCKDGVQFAPANGICYYCGHQIYKEVEHIGYKGRKYTTGIPTDKARILVTGCPHCGKSYCN